MSIHVAITPEDVLNLNRLHVYLTCPGCIVSRQKCPYPGANTLPIHERCNLYKEICKGPNVSKSDNKLIVLFEANK